MKLNEAPPSTRSLNEAVLASGKPGASGHAAPPPPLPVPAPQLNLPLAGPETAAQTARQINAFLKMSSIGVEFMVDKQSDQVIVRIIDTESGKLIRQIPSEEMVAISHALDRATGLLFAQKA